MSSEVKYIYSVNSVDCFDCWKNVTTFTRYYNFEKNGLASYWGC